MKDFKHKLDIQLFADEPPVTDPTPPTEPVVVNKPSYTQEQLDEIAEARASRASDAALKDFFKKQGMEEEEIKAALKAYKESKQASQPDVTTLNSELTKAQKDALQARTESRATMLAVSLGVDAKQIPYLLKLVDITIPDKGEPKEEDIKAALEKVLEDIPAFKAQSEMPRFSKGTSQNPAQALTEQQAYLAKKYKGNPYFKG